MLAILLSWIIITFVFLSFGNMLISVFATITKKETSYSFIDTFMLGLCATGTTVTLFSIWIPANTSLMVGLIAFSMIYWLFKRKELCDLCQRFKKSLTDTKPLHLLLMFIAVISIAIYATGAPTWVDSPFYHFQNIMWNEQFHVVPGLANLQPRMGFNNNYFLLCSTFGLKPLFGQYILGVHTLCIAAVLGWVIHRSLKSDNLAQMIIPPVLMLGFIFGYKIHIASPSTDQLPNLLIAFLVLKLMFDGDAIKRNPLVYFCIPVYAVTLKLSAFVICLFALYILWYCIKNKEYRALVFFIAFGTLVAVPWCARTIILSGYLIFPYPSIDLFSFDWKIPAEYAHEQEIVIYAFARVDTLPMDEALTLSMREWIPLWWKSGMFYYTPLVCRISFILCLIAIPLMILLPITQQANRRKHSSLYVAWLISLLGFMFWFKSAPDFRFGFGFVFSVALIPLYILLDMFSEKVEKKEKTVRLVQLFANIIVILFISLQSIRWGYYKRIMQQPLYYTLLYKPQSLEYTKRLKENLYKSKIEFLPSKESNVAIYKANIESHCYECELPCSTDYTEGIEMRGKTLQEGFRTIPGSKFRRSY